MATPRKFNRGIRKPKAPSSGSERKPKDQLSLVDFLAAVQRTKTLIMRLAPEEGRDILGTGLSGTIEQSYFNTSTNLAFKQGIPSQSERDEGAEQDWASLIREIVILQHDPVRSHPCFAKLIGVSFSVMPYGANEWRAWPVLISRKSSEGDLGALIQNDAKALTEVTRLRLFAQVAEAVYILHSNGNYLDQRHGHHI